MSTSRIRQNFSAACEDGINKQINLELYASYVYMSMAFYFDRDDVALPGFHKFFKKMSDEEREHAEKLMKYQNSRGGRIILRDVTVSSIKPAMDEWGSGLNAIESALQLEKTVNQSLLDLHKVAGEQNDVNFSDFLESHYLQEQIDSIKELSGFATNLKRVGPGLGEFMFDKETLGGDE
jgi:ferritin heavy chain